MKRIVVAAAATIACCLATLGGARAQAVGSPTAEQLIQAAREIYRPPGLRAECAPGEAGEIVVCAPAPDKHRVTSSTEDAIANGDPVYDGIPRAPDPFPKEPCVPSLLSFCGGVGPPPPQPLLIDLEALPKALTPEEAALVFRAEERLDEP